MSNYSKTKSTKRFNFTVNRNFTAKKAGSKKAVAKKATAKKAAAKKRAAKK